MLPSTLFQSSTYLTQGYWEDRFDVSTHWNLSDVGINAKSGALSYSVTSNWYDDDGINEDHAYLVRKAFSYIETVTGIQFHEVSEPLSSEADIAFGNNDPGAFAQSEGSTGRPGRFGYTERANINIAPDWYIDGPSENDYVFQTIIHELGHIFGLGHPGNYNGTANFEADAQFENDSWQTSIMSYFSGYENTNIDADYAFVQTFMAADLLALDELYGDQSYNGIAFGTSSAFLGDTIYGFNSNITNETDPVLARLYEFGSENAYCIVDSGGIDTFDFSGWSADQLIDLRASSLSEPNPTASDIGGLRGNLTLAVGTVIENAIGGDGDDFIFGNTVSNTLDGGFGNDHLRASKGRDWVYGGEGHDELFGDSGDDDLYGGEGHDELNGGSGEDKLRGGSGNDVLTGKSGEDCFFGDAGFDVFVFLKRSDSNKKKSKADDIKDFEQGRDLVDLQNIDASTKLSGNNKFTFDGKTPFGNSKRGDIYYEKFNKSGSDKDYTMVYIDTDARSDVEMSIKFKGLINFTADDFIL